MPERNGLLGFGRAGKIGRRSADTGSFRYFYLSGKFQLWY